MKATTTSYDKFLNFLLILIALILIGFIVIIFDMIFFTKTKQLSSEEIHYKVLDYDPPKHFYVYVEDVKTKKVKKEYISKHCSSYPSKSPKVGEIVTVVNSYIEHESNFRDPHIIKRNNIYSVFCP